MAGKVENKKIEEYENENYYLLWWSDKRHFPYNSLGLSGEDNSVSRTDNFVIVNVFNSVTSSRVTGNWKLCKKRRINIWNYHSSYLQYHLPNAGHLGWQHMHSFTKWHLWRQSTISLMHRDHLVGNRYFVPFFAFYTESVMLGPRFIRESIFYTQSVMLSPRFVPECVFCFVLYFPSHAVSDMFFLYLFSS